MTEFETCCVVNQFCDAPANLEYDRAPRLGKCYHCGQRVCRECSTRRVFEGARVKVCNDCEEEHYPDGRARLLLRTYHRAGYPDRTMASVIQELADQDARLRQERVDDRDRVRQSLQVIITSAGNVASRLKQLGVRDRTIRSSTNAIERHVQRLDTLLGMVLGKDL